ncbi:hypothetical protein DYB25_012489, partial [Aphanomyces astaci]
MPPRRKRSTTTIEDAKNNTRTDSTKKRYTTQIRTIVQWAMAHGHSQGVLDRNTLNLATFSFGNFTKFLEWCYQTKHMAASTLGSYRSAIVFLYEKQGVTIPQAFQDELPHIMKGYSRFIAADIEEGVQTTKSKRPLTIEEMKRLTSRSVALADAVGVALDGVDRLPNVATHSIRKGAVTFASSGCTSGPSTGVFTTRAGCSLGDVLDRYIHFVPAGGQYTGRIVSGLPESSAAIGTLPPHFGARDDPVVTDALRVVLPTLSNAACLSTVLRMCLASVVYHMEWLVDTFPQHHTLFSTVLFRNKDLLHQLAPNVTINDGNIRRTGIPPHVHLYTQLEVMRNELQSTRDELQTARSELHNVHVHGKVDIILAELQSMRTASTP